MWVWMVIMLCLIAFSNNEARSSLRKLSEDEGLKSLRIHKISRDFSSLEVIIEVADNHLVSFDLKLDKDLFAPHAKVTYEDSHSSIQTQHTFIFVDRTSHEWASAHVMVSEEDSIRILSGVFVSHRLGGEFTVSHEESQHVFRRLSSIGQFQDLAVHSSSNVHKERMKRVKKIKKTKKTTTIPPTHQPSINPISVSVSNNNNSRTPSTDPSENGGADSNIFFPGCFPGDQDALTVYISIATDVGFMEHATGGSILSSAMEQQNAVTQAVEQAVSVVRPLYLAQFNVQLQIQDIVIGTSNSSQALQSSPSANNCPADLLALMELFGLWTVTEPQAAHWHLLSNCYSTGYVGVGYIGGLCEQGGSNIALSSVTPLLWLTMAHEIGHVFGALHTFYDGEGGIMDYGDGSLFGGAVQFHPLNGPEMCAQLTDVVNEECPYIAVTPASSLCGNGVLEPDEECECTPSLGVKSCGVCQGCLLSSPVACTVATDGFVVRLPSTVPYIATSSPTLIADPDCCSNGQLAGQSCNNGVDVCSLTGTCEQACSKYLLTPCGFDSTGCIQKCMYLNTCQGATLTTMTAPFTPIGAVPNGISCSTTNSGTCQQGVCTLPTNVPTLIESNTGAPPMMSTLPPSSQPTVVSQPPSPPTGAPQNQLSLPCPSSVKLTTCPNYSTKKTCQAKDCAWCSDGPDESVRQNCAAAAAVCGFTASQVQEMYAGCPPFSNNVTAAG